MHGTREKELPALSAHLRKVPAVSFSYSGTVTRQNAHNPLTAVNKDFVSGLKQRGRVAAANNRGDAKLSCDNGGMGQRRPNVGHDCRDSGEKRGPADIL